MGRWELFSRSRRPNWSPLLIFSRLESGFLPPEVRGFSPAGSGSSLMTGGVRFGKLKVVKAEDLSFRFGG